MSEWLPGVHCDAKVCPIVTVALPDSSVRQERLRRDTFAQSQGHFLVSPSSPRLSLADIGGMACSH